MYSNMDKKLILDVEQEKQHIQNEKYRAEWKMCCSHTDSHFFRFIIQVVLGIVILCFSMIQICLADPDQDTSIYFSLISMVAGIFFAFA